MPSQSGQTAWVSETLKKIRNGVFVDIGCQGPLLINNTDILELELDWWGLSLDIHENSIKKWNGIRNTDHVLACDATKQNYGNLFRKHGLPNKIDYLSIDLEPPPITFKVLQMLPFDEYKFSLITFEHDDYRKEFSKHDLKKKSRTFLTSKGYQRISDEIVDSWNPRRPGKHSVCEDWYYHPDLIKSTQIFPCSMTIQEQQAKYREKW